MRTVTLRSTSKLTLDEYMLKLFGSEAYRVLTGPRNRSCFAVCRRLLGIPGEPTPEMMVREVLEDSPYHLRLQLRDLTDSYRIIDEGTDGASVSEVRIGDDTFRFIDLGEDARVHGTVRNGFIQTSGGSDRGEAILLGCRRTLLSIAEEDGWFLNELSDVLPSTQLRKTCLEDSDVLDSAGLREDRFDIILLFMALLRQRMKDAGPMETRDQILNRDLKGKTKRTRNMEWNSPFREHFTKVEFDNSVTAEMADAMADAFVQMLDADLLPRIPRTYSLRFRKFVNYNNAGLLMPTMHNIVVSTKLPGCFVHEYMHAYTNEKGYCDGEMFRPVLERYRSLIDKTSYDKKFRDYLKIPTEVYSRCFEQYINMTIGTNVLQKSTENDDRFPDDEVLNRMILDYFTSLRENGWEEKKD